MQRGLDKILATQVATQLTKHDALAAHARDELGIHEMTQAKPFQAALASGASFITGSTLPLLVALFAPISLMIVSQYLFSIVFLALIGFAAAKAGGSDVGKGILRNCVWGTAAIGITALVGHLFGVHSG